MPFPLRTIPVLHTSDATESVSTFRGNLHAPETPGNVNHSLRSNEQAGTVADTGVSVTDKREQLAHLMGEVWGGGCSMTFDFV